MAGRSLSGLKLQLKPQEFQKYFTISSQYLKAISNGQNGNAILARYWRDLDTELLKEFMTALHTEIARVQKAEEAKAGHKRNYTDPEDTDEVGMGSIPMGICMGSQGGRRAPREAPSMSTAEKMETVADMLDIIDGIASMFLR